MRLLDRYMQILPWKRAVLNLLVGWGFLLVVFALGHLPGNEPLPALPVLAVLWPMWVGAVWGAELRARNARETSAARTPGISTKPPRVVELTMYAAVGVMVVYIVLVFLRLYR